MPTCNNDNGWPNEAAERAKLYIPPSWGGAVGEDMDATCLISYDTTTKLLSVIRAADENHEVLDVLDPADIIGVDLEIKLFGAMDELHHHVGFRNSKGLSREHDTRNDDDSESDIFELLGQDVEKIFRCNDDDIPAYESQATAILNIYCYPRKHPSQTSWGNWMGLIAFEPKPQPYYLPALQSETTPGFRYAHHRQLEVVRSEDFYDIQTLIRAIRQVAKLPNPPVRHLVLLNPHGGPKKAQSIYDSVVKPMLEQASVNHDLVVTERANHAREYMESVDIERYDGVICMSGDGLIHETLQGIRNRPDANHVLKTLKLGVIGCGTSNGLAKSILHESKELYSPLESTFMICKGQTSKLDLSEYTTKNKNYISFLTYSYGMIADIDIDSEVLRCLGAFRLDLWGAYLGIKLRSYPVKLSYLPPPSDKTHGMGNLPALDEPIPKDWVTIEDDIVLIWASQVSHAASHIESSPSSRLHDGVFQIMMIRRRGLSRYKMIMWLLSLDSQSSHTKRDITEMIECVAWRLEPGREGSYNNVDGEAVESGPIQTKILPSVTQVFGNSTHQFYE